MKNEMTVFENKQIRQIYDEKKEKWYFSVVDIIAVLIDKDYQSSRNYWKVLKKRLISEGAHQPVTNCNQLKLTAEDGKERLTDVADVETILRIIQSVPSPKAEPIKQWLAKVGYERMEETVDPEQSINRARENWKKHGRSQKWIQQRMMGQETRNKLTDYWQDHDVNDPKDFAFLTNVIHQEWSGVSVKQHKKIKELKTQNLRDHMTDAELIFTALAELSSRQIAESVNATGVKENENAGIEGGRLSKRARIALEKKTGRKVVTSTNYLNDAVTKLKK